MNPVTCRKQLSTLVWPGPSWLLARRLLAGAALAGGLALLAACGGGHATSPDAAAAAADEDTQRSIAAVLTANPSSSQRDAVRLADQASFGASETLVASIRAQGAAAWVAAQLAATEIGRAHV